MFTGRPLKYSRNILPPAKDVVKCSRAHPDGVADLLGVEVVVDEAVDDVGEVGLHQGVAQQLQLVRDGAQGAAQLRQETD